MQAIIMAAGKGSRLGSITNGKPKAFVEIEGIKLIEYNIALLHENGIKDIKVVTGYKCEEYEALLGEIPGITFIYNPFYEMVNVLGSFFVAQDKLADEDTIYLHADTLCAPEIMRNLIKTNGDIVLPIDYKECDEEAMKVKICDSRIEAISKKVALEDSAGEFIGIAKLSKNILPSIKEASKELLKDKKFNEYFEAIIQYLIDRKTTDKIIPIPTEGLFWGEVDFIEDYERVKADMPEDLLGIAKKDLGYD